MQTVLGVLVSSRSVTVNGAPKEMDFDLEDLSFKVSETLDPRGFMVDTSVGAYFEEVSVDVKVTTNESEERIKELQAQIEARWPIYTLFNATNVKANDSWRKV